MKKTAGSQGSRAAGVKKKIKDSRRRSSTQSQLLAVLDLRISGFFKEPSLKAVKVSEGKCMH